MNFKEEPSILTQTRGQEGPRCSLKHALVAHGLQPFLSLTPESVFSRNLDQLIQRREVVLANLEISATLGQPLGGRAA